MSFVIALCARQRIVAPLRRIEQLECAIERAPKIEATHLPRAIVQTFYDIARIENRGAHCIVEIQRIGARVDTLQITLQMLDDEYTSRRDPERCFILNGAHDDLVAAIGNAA